MSSNRNLNLPHIIGEAYLFLYTKLSENKYTNKWIEFPKIYIFSILWQRTAVNVEAALVLMRIIGIYFHRVNVD